MNYLSFLTSIYNHSYSDDDENIKPKQEIQKMKKRLRTISSSSDEEKEKESVPSDVIVKLPKIKLHKKLSTGDSDISFKPAEITIFDALAPKFTDSLKVVENDKTSTVKSVETCENARYEHNSLNQSHKENVINDEHEENLSSEKQKKKNKENVNELGEKIRESQLNSLAVAKNRSELNAIVQRCESILAEKKAEKKKNTSIHKKNKVRNKKQINKIRVYMYLFFFFLIK